MGDPVMPEILTLPVTDALGNQDELSTGLVLTETDAVTLPEADELENQDEVSRALADPAVDGLTDTEVLEEAVTTVDGLIDTELLEEAVANVDGLTDTELLAEALASSVTDTLPEADELPSQDEVSRALTDPAVDGLTDTELLAEAFFDTLIIALLEGDTLTVTEPLVVHDTLGLPDCVGETLVEAVSDFSAVDDTDFLGEAEDVTVIVIGDFEELAVIVTDPLADLELLGETVEVFVIEVLAVTDTLP